MYMSLEEIMELLRIRGLNSKNNNHIITELTPEERKIILDGTANAKMVIENFDTIKYEYYSPKVPFLRNILIDLSEVPVKEIFNLVLEMLEIKDRLLTLEDWKSILRFRGLLAKYGQGIQFIFYNPGFVKPEEQALINQIYTLSEYLYCSNFLLLDGERLSTYADCKGRMLDPREDYQKIIITRH